MRKTVYHYFSNIIVVRKLLTLLIKVKQAQDFIKAL